MGPIAGVTLLAGKPVRAALFQPLLRRAVPIEWQTAYARLLAAGGSGVVSIVAAPASPSPLELGVVRGADTPLARCIPVEPHRALFLAAQQEGLVSAGESAPLLFVDWDLHALTVCVLAVAAGEAQQRACVVEPALGTAGLDEPLGVGVVLPALTGLSAEVAASGLSPAGRERVARIGGRLLRECWSGPRESFTVALPPGFPIGGARGALVTVPRDDILAHCRRALADARDLVLAAVEQCGLPEPPRIILSGEAARWGDLQAALHAALPASALAVPDQPECFQARGAAEYGKMEVWKHGNR